MSMHDTLKGKLTPELLAQVEDALGDDFNYDYVPRDRLNKVIKQRNELREQIAAKPKDNTDDDDDDDGAGKPPASNPNAENPTKDKDSKKALKELQTAHEKELADLKVQYAALDKLRAANAIDPDLIWNSGLIDKTKLAFDETKNLTGLDEQMTSLTKDRGYLFGAAGKGAAGTGKDGGADGDADPTGLDAKLEGVWSNFGLPTK